MQHTETAFKPMTRERAIRVCVDMGFAAALQQIINADRGYGVEKLIARDAASREALQQVLEMRDRVAAAGNDPERQAYVRGYFYGSHFRFVDPLDLHLCH